MSTKKKFLIGIMIFLILGTISSLCIWKISTMRKKETPSIAEPEIKKPDAQKEVVPAFEQFDSREHKITRVLEEYLDPQISDERKNDIRIYLRVSTIDNPEDKQILKDSLFDPRYEELKEAIEVSLKQAIQKHPTEEDKKYLLEMVENKPGILLETLSFVWDERFIPGLIKQASDKTLDSQIRADAITQLGFHKVEEAVPCLEKILMDDNEDSKVMQQIFYALPNITGKDYYHMYKDKADKANNSWVQSGLTATSTGD